MTVAQLDQLIAQHSVKSREGEMQVPRVKIGCAPASTMRGIARVGALEVTLSSVQDSVARK